MSASPDTATFNGEDLNFDDFQLEDFDTPTIAEPLVMPERDLSFFKKIPVTVTLEVASKEIALGDLMKAGEGSVIELDKLNGEPLDVKVNGSLMGHAEVVVVNDKYGLRLIDVLDSALAGVTQ
ncbi:flagellar motor switch protein FliN [Enterovibrio norvegicus FF-33]|uniref:Flagellar motor switch protein FliN n=1 Tax=Enterovibrio norvegicus FF-454 TaxID=1185651 RepID=A0A1E5BYX8_9GAMM|nr:flagellar motor switch protein FliN [Enterovibrio norvegicus]OEE58409.1 flagellar motor switch protein FliN [Enterovibrio norvegicus FF-454]OEE70343.1 flagellar motor switch protein FliN [Enterovibrio norvegicus FF-33]OEE77978.1 flagellar motor switch protein FliN [Enterovibrio norvegicus FF-162]